MGCTVVAFLSSCTPVKHPLDVRRYVTLVLTRNKSQTASYSTLDQRPYQGGITTCRLASHRRCQIASPCSSERGGGHRTEGTEGTEGSEGSAPTPCSSVKLTTLSSPSTEHTFPTHASTTVKREDSIAHARHHHSPRSPPATSSSIDTLWGELWVQTPTEIAVLLSLLLSILKIWGRECMCVCCHHIYSGRQYTHFGKRGGSTLGHTEVRPKQECFSLLLF